MSLNRRSFLLGSAAALAVGPQMAKPVDPFMTFIYSGHVEPVEFDAFLPRTPQDMVDEIARSIGIIRRHATMSVEIDSATGRVIEKSRQIGQTFSNAIGPPPEYYSEWYRRVFGDHHATE